ncbi:MAG: glycoside hydrolase family 2 protein [Saprospiraceae bacterium]|nr:glycoside hydrolase family 2 protein [Saprospiraceae bacterium]
MKHFLLFISALLPMVNQAQTNYASVRQSIQNTAWTFRQATDSTAQWKSVTAPISVHTALLQNGIIEDPFYRDNEEKLQWIEKEDWEFQTTFDVDPTTLSKKHIELILKGIDTYAQIYLNDTLILETDNMFRIWKADVKRLLKPTGNKLHFYFESPLKKTEAAWKALGYELPGGQRVMSRKAQFHYGWDWGPKFVGCGILKMPELLAWDDLLLENVYITTQSVTPELAKMVARYRYRSDFTGPVTVIARDGKRKSVEDRKFWAGVHEDSVTFEVQNPKLWWCAGMGEPHLYDFGIEVKREVRVVDRADVRMGIRKVELITEKDQNGKGESFYFKLNGKPVFAKGANYIPQDIFQDRVTPDKYKRLIDDALAANMNMLRVWGGGIYEDDVFYQLCDARGIMVWQDFMYACALYPGNGSFLKTAAKEALDQIERLRQHPCIALWCGNNENSEAWHHWGWQMPFSEAQRAQLWRDYQILFSDLLRTYVERNAIGVPYWESSPKFGRGNPKSMSEGDSHYWGVWHDEEPFEILNKKVPRFMSEFGFQSFPEWRTIQSFTLPEDRKLDSKVMLLHQKHPRGNALIAEYMKRDYRNPKTFEDFVYVSQLLQAEGMRTGIEAQRRNKPYCMGTLYWQLNDVWQVASWSGIDYFGRWKALHYYARECYSPLAALPIIDGDILKLYGVNDMADTAHLTLRVRALTYEGKVLSDVTQVDTHISPDSSRMVWQGTLKTVLNKNKPENSVVDIMLTNDKGKTVYRRLFYPVSPKKMALSKTDVNLKVEQVNDGYQITLSADRLAKNVMISTEVDGFFSDNYFDLLPGERKTVLFKTERILDEPQAAFKTKSLVDAWE